MLENDKTKKTGDLFNTAYFTAKELRPGEILKPMILNAGNSKTMRDITGSSYIDDWGNTTVTVYVDPAVRFGRDTVEGLRIREHATAKPETIALLKGYAESGNLSPEQSAFIRDNVDTWTEPQAQAILTKVGNKAA